MAQAQKKALILGASGLTGNLLLQQLLNNPVYQQVYAYVRREMPVQHPKLIQLVTNYDQLDSAVDADDVFCCLGTTIKKAGSQEAFRQVDLVYPLKVATLQRQSGSTHFLLISAIGANARSGIFYSRTKGEAEEGITALQYPITSIFQPSLIVGNRDERRTGEKIAMYLMPIFAPLLMGSWRKYRPIAVEKLANAMFRAAQDTGRKGLQVYQFDELNK
jgi:uncharacterized protein YbjT (DUF2867 family)